MACPDQQHCPVCKGVAGFASWFSGWEPCGDCEGRGTLEAFNMVHDRRDAARDQGS